MTGEFAGKSVIVTGASSGLGAALALELAHRGVDLALFSFEEERQEDVARQCREAGGRSVAVTGDVTRPEDCARLVRTAVEAYGRLDCVVANVVTEVLDAILETVAGAVGRTGRLVLSGMRVGEAASILARLERHGFEVGERREREGFEALEASRTGGAR